MFKRNHTQEKNNKHKEENISTALKNLNKCIYLPYDDKLIIRNKIINQQQQILAIFDQYNRDNVLSQLQNQLRKYIHNLKANAQGHFESKSKGELQKRMHSQPSLTKMTPRSISSSPQTKTKKKIVIDIIELTKKIENTHKIQNNKRRTHTLTIDHTEKQSQILSERRKNTTKPHKKMSARTIQSTETTQTQRHDVQTPEMHSLQNSIQKITQFTRSPKHHFFNDIFESPQISKLMKDKLSKRKASVPSIIAKKQQDITITPLELYEHHDQYLEEEKQNINSFNKTQAWPSSFFKNQCLSLESSTHNFKQTIQEQVHPMFGQFHKKIANIINGNN